ncbi:hypothetical protein, partial [Campylobacter upsaliensis]|uniref:hypothetical protein n=1 Tax=Campylobacter upsaliensis TaxID=28080 RepID=UPI0022EB98BD
MVKILQKTSAGIAIAQSSGNLSNGLTWAADAHGNNFEYLSLAFAYKNNLHFNDIYFRFKPDSRITGDLTIDTDSKEGNDKVWTKIHYVYDRRPDKNDNNRNLTIENLNIQNDTKLEFKPKGNNTVTTINHSAKQLNLKIENGSSITVTNINQDSGTTEISGNSIKIENFKLNAGSVNNNGGTITTLTNTGGTINNTSGSIATLTNNKGGSVTMGQGTITTLTSNQGGNITNAGTITSLTYTAAPTTKAIQTKANTDSITNTGTITTFTNNGGHITNSGNGNIANLTNSNGNVNNSANIQTLQSTNGNINNMKGTISTLTNNNGGSLNNIQGTIENLKITSGDFELNNMQQGRIANIEIGGNGKININDNMNIGYNNGISTFRIASGAAPTLNFGEVRTATTAQETYATVKLVDSTNNANTTQARVAIDKLTIALVSEDTQIGKSVSLANSVSGAANTGVGNVYVKSADFSQDLKRSGFYGKFNAQTQTIDTRFNANLGAAGLFSQAF